MLQNSAYIPFLHTLLSNNRMYNQKKNKAADHALLNIFFLDLNYLYTAVKFICSDIISTMSQFA